MSEKVSADRFTVVYRIKASMEEAQVKARAICHEQTVEFPEELVPEGFIKDNVVGRLEALDEVKSEVQDVFFDAHISYAADTASSELTQLLNVIFGNTSIKPGIRVQSLILSENLLSLFKGPRFGVQGLRHLLGVQKRPMLATALKPMGLSSHELADLAYKCTIGGIDIIKDDHGLTDQTYSPFAERVEACVAAVARGNADTGSNSIFVANVTAPADQVIARARLAKELGAGGLLIAPGLTGWDVMRQLSEDETIALPIICHPAFLGSFVTSSDSGMAHGVIFGELVRLAGGDATIFPNFGGRFSFSMAECRDIASAATKVMGRYESIFPAPGGGMSLDAVSKSLAVYGNDVIFLVGGGLFKDGPDVAANARKLRKLVE